jgi:glycosyltransferase involved in cell wall biosynthesis
MAGLSSKPLLTFTVAAFNQERFVREAVEGAFAQTYSPLEIILSDDCSQDGTFDIMRDMAAAYRGPHRMVLNRNPARRSIGGHLNRLVELAQGELIVGAAGDDISLPQRTQALYDAWERSGRRATSIHSNFVQIDEGGRQMARVYHPSCDGATQELIDQAVEPLAYARTLEPVVFGCTHAFARGLFSMFGDLPANIIHEDNALAFRSALGGRLLYVNQVLVKYRVHGDNVYIRSREPRASLETLAREEDCVRRGFRNRETMYDGFLLDLEQARLKSLIGAAEAAKVAQEVKRRRHRAWLIGKFLDSGLLDRFRILLRLRREGLGQAEFGMLARRLLPRPLLLRLRLARGCLAPSHSS